MWLQPTTTTGAVTVCPHSFGDECNAGRGDKRTENEVLTSAVGRCNGGKRCRTVKAGFPEEVMSTLRL